MKLEKQTFETIQKSILLDKEITGTELKIYGALLTFRNSKTRIARPGVARIQEKTGCSNKTIIRAIDELEKKGAIRRIRRLKEGKNSNDTNLYIFNDHYKPELCREQEEPTYEWDSEWDTDTQGQGTNNTTIVSNEHESCEETTEGSCRNNTTVGVQTTDKPNLRTKPKNQTEETIDIEVQTQPQKYKGWAEPAAIVKAWNDAVGDSFAHVYRMTDERKKKIRARQAAFKNDKPEEDARQLPFWKTIFEAMTTMPFLKGENNRGWRANFDFVVRSDETLVNLIEGKYASQKEEWVEV